MESSVVEDTLEVRGCLTWRRARACISLHTFNIGYGIGHRSRTLQRDTCTRTEHLYTILPFYLLLSSSADDDISVKLVRASANPISSRERHGPILSTAVASDVLSV